MIRTRFAGIFLVLWFQSKIVSFKTRRFRSVDSASSNNKHNILRRLSYRTFGIQSKNFKKAILEKDKNLHRHHPMSGSFAVMPPVWPINAIFAAELTKPSIIKLFLLSSRPLYLLPSTYYVDEFIKYPF